MGLSFSMRWLLGVRIFQILYLFLNCILRKPMILFRGIILLKLCIIWASALSGADAF